MKSFTAIRQDKWFRPRERSVVSIDEEVFGARAGAGGHRWILSPPPAIRKRFWELFGSSIGTEEDVFVAEGAVLLEAVRDIHERPIPGLEGRAGEAALFFVDHVPAANWSHSCAYFFHPKNGYPFRVEHRWPPSEAVRLSPLARPSNP